MLATMLPVQRVMDDRFARILRNARAAAQTNPRIAPLADPVTVTDRGAVQPEETTALYPLAASDHGVWRVIGGMVQQDANNILSAVIKPGVWTPSAARVEVMADSRYLSLLVKPAAVPYRLLVDGRFASMTGTMLAVTGGGTKQWLLADFGTRAVRRVTVDLALASGVFAGAVEPTARLWPVERSDDAHAVFLGDSYVLGSGPTTAADGVAPQLGDRLGLRMQASGSGGTGWSTGNAAYRFDERIANGDLSIAADAPDVILLMTSYNDRLGAPATITANALAGLRAARAQFPGVPIVVFGAAAAASGPGAGIVAAEQAVQAAVTEMADPLCGFVPVSTDPRGAWIGGTGRLGAPTGNGNSDVATGSDGVHPSDHGAALLARRYADGALALLMRMARA
jgi:lysophospholipase L1-like esterase